MPGSPEPNHSNSRSQRSTRRPIHPAAALVFCAALGVGLSLVHAPIPLALCAAVFFAAALHVEGRAPGREAPFLILALVVLAAHLVFGGRPLRESIRPASEIALRLLALVYLTRWAARAVLPRAARWLFGQAGPSRPRPLVLVFESGRSTVALLPLALAEAERQHRALRARALRPGRGLGGRARYLAAWFLPYLGTMLRVGDAYGESLQARGYLPGSRRRSSAVFGWGVPETAIVVVSLTALVWLARA